MSSSLRERRSDRREILDFTVSEDTAAGAYRQLALLHLWLGDTAAIITALRRDRLPVRRVLDIGCAGGQVLEIVARRLGLEAVGVDLKPPRARAPVRILEADAVHDPLPEADVAISLHTAHHLDEEALAALIRNVGRSCRRFILLDVVRHWLPLALFRTFIAPFALPVVAADGLTSFCRAYTPRELGRIAEAALEGTGSSFACRLAPLLIRQVLDIQYRANRNSGAVPSAVRCSLHHVRTHGAFPILAGELQL